MEEEETQVHGIAIFQVYEELTFMKVVQFTQTDIAKKGTGLKIMQVSWRDCSFTDISPLFCRMVFQLD